MGRAIESVAASRFASARRLLALLVGLLASLALIVSGAGAASAQNVVGRRPQNSILTIECQATAAPTSSGLEALPLRPIVSATGVAADTAADDLPGVVKGWGQRTADNGKGTVWQEPGATGNANSIRTMDPNAQYRNGYVRFYNARGQPIGLDGKPGPNSATRIPRGPDGNYPIPKGWGQ